MTINLEDIQKQLIDITRILESKFTQIQVTGNQVVVGQGLSDIDTRLGIMQAGEFRSGNGKIPGDGFTGGRYGFPGFEYGGDTYFLAGVDNDVLQVGMSLTNGKILGGAGDVVVDGEGIWIKNQQAAFGFENTLNQRFKIYLFSDGFNSLVLANKTGNTAATIRMAVDTTLHNALYAVFGEDPTDPEVPLFQFYSTAVGSTAAKLSLDGEVILWAGKNGKQTVFNASNFDVDFIIRSVTHSSAFALDAAGELIQFFGGTLATFDNGTDHRLEIGSDHYLPTRASSNPNVFFNEANQDMDFQIETLTGIGLKVDAGDHAVYMDGDLIFRTDGSGVPFGSCYGNDINWTQAAAVQNTWYKISDADIDDGELNLVTHDGSGKLTVTKGGRYRITYALVIAANSANKQLQSGIAINNTENAAGIDHETTTGVNTQKKMGSTAIIDIPANGTIQISFRTTDAGTPDISVEHFNITVGMVGGT